MTELRYTHRPGYSYQPTRREIAQECANIRAGWDTAERIKRCMRQGRVSWELPVLIDIEDSRGEFVCIMGERIYG